MTFLFTCVYEAGSALRLEVTSPLVLESRRGLPGVVKCDEQTKPRQGLWLAAKRCREYVPSRQRQAVPQRVRDVHHVDHVAE
jgi:hypothetical protein